MRRATAHAARTRRSTTARSNPALEVVVPVIADNGVSTPGSSPSGGAQVIADFDSADLVRFDFDADSSTVNLDPFRLVDAFDGQGGELVVSYSSRTDRTSLSGDVDGDKTADIVVILKGDHRDFTAFINGPEPSSSDPHALVT